MSKELKAPKMPEDQALQGLVAEEKAKAGEAPGVRFAPYFFPLDETATHLTTWWIHLEHTTSNWMGDITPDTRVPLATPKLYGTFTQKATASGPNLGTDVVAKLLPGLREVSLPARYCDFHRQLRHDRHPDHARR